MKVFVDIQKECQIGKIDDEGRALFKGDVNADILKIYFKHYDGMAMNWFLTISGILPNGRPIAPTDHDGILGSEVIDGVEWKYYQFTLSKPNGFNLMKGLVTMYVRLNYTNSDAENPKVIKEKTIAVINANVVETSEYNDNLLLLGESIEEVVFNFKQQIENLAARIANDNNTKIVNYLQVLSRVLSNLIPSENEIFSLGNALFKWLTLWVKTIQADQINVNNNVNADVINTSTLNVLDDDGVKAIANITKAIIDYLEANNLVVKGNVQVNGIVDSAEVSTNNMETVDFLTTNATVNEQLKAKVIVTEAFTSKNAIVDGVESQYARFGVNRELEITEAKATYRGVELADLNDINTRVSTEEFNSKVSQLQSQIDGINAGQNLADIVGTYALLQTYNTSNLNVDDKIQVLKDETKEDDSTIYKWNGTAFEYIGSYSSNVYTKAEVETKLSKKQNNLIAGDGVTIIDDRINMDLDYYLGETNDVDNSVGGIVFYSTTLPVIYDTYIDAFEYTLSNLPDLSILKGKKIKVKLGGDEFTMEAYANYVYGNAIPPNIQWAINYSTQEPSYFNLICNGKLRFANNGDTDGFIDKLKGVPLIITYEM